MSNGKNHWIQVGTIGKPHGLRGGFFVSGRSGLLPKGVKSLMLRLKDSKLRLSLSTQRLQSGRVLLSCKEFNSPEEVKEFVGQTLWCLRADIKTDDGEYLWADLIDCKVIDLHGNLVGSIVRVENHGASDIVTINAPKSSKHVSIPFVATYFDMSFSSSDESISLLVGCDLFQDLWEDE